LGRDEARLRGLNDLSYVRDNAPGVLELLSAGLIQLEIGTVEAPA
jgi:hypothetical protein